MRVAGCTVDVTVAAAALMLAACASGGGRSDGGAARDMTVSDASVAGGKLLAPGDFTSLALAADGTAIVTDAHGNVLAVPAGGAATATMLETGANLVVRAGAGVFVWHGGGAQEAALAVYGAGQIHELDPASPSDPSYAGSVAADGTHVAYLGNFNGGKADLVAAQPDGTSPVTLLQGLTVGGSCVPSVALVVGKVIVSRCYSGGFAVSSIDPDSGAATTLLAPSAAGFAVVPERGAVVVENPTNGSAIVPVDGSAATPLSGDVKRSLPLADGSAVVQVTNGGGMVRARLPDGGLTSLAAAGAGDLEAVSPDGNWVLYSGAPDAASGDAALYLTSAAKTTTPSAINSATTTPPLVGGAFTDDSSFVVYTTDADANGYGPLRARPLGGAIGASTTLSLGSTGFAPAGGARIVYSDGYSTATGTKKLSVAFVDLAGVAPVTLADGVAAWRLSDDKSLLVYLAPGGVFARALP